MNARKRCRRPFTLFVRQEASFTLFLMMVLLHSFYVLTDKNRANRSGQRLEDVSVIYVSVLLKRSFDLPSCHDALDILNVKGRRRDPFIHAFVNFSFAFKPKSMDITERERECCMQSTTSCKIRRKDYLQKEVSFLRCALTYCSLPTIVAVVLFQLCNLHSSLSNNNPNIGRKCLRIQGTSKDDDRHSSAVFRGKKRHIPLPRFDNRDTFFRMFTTAQEHDSLRK